jgi:PhnB protein
MTDASVYLTFNGICAQAMRFYHDVLGGTLEMQTHAEAMPAEYVQKGMENRIIHARLTLNKTVIMASDGMIGQDAPMSGFSVSLNYGNAGDARAIFEKLADGGKVTMPFDKTFWSPGFGMLVDRFGTPWMVNTESSEARNG